jgi:hypothetical protein
MQLVDETQRQHGYRKGSGEAHLWMTSEAYVKSSHKYSLIGWDVSRLVKLAASSWLTVAGLGCSIPQRENGLL